MAGGGTVRTKYAVYIFKIFRNEHTGSVYAQLFSLIHPHRYKPIHCVPVDVCKKRRNDAFESKKITINNNLSQYKIIIYNKYI